MIGQNRFKEKVSEFIDNKRFPLFSILVGQKGIGKKTACKYIAQQLGCQYIIWENKIDDIRELKLIMESQDQEIIYVIPDYEDMSPGARNSILKICEEPPRNAHIILTSYSKEIIIPTIIGRGTVFELDPYTDSELLEIIHQDNLDESILDLCSVPGELSIAKETNVEEFKTFVDSVWHNIKKASAGNLLKVTNKIKLKEDGKGYDLNLFINYLYKLNSVEETSKEKLRIFTEILEARRSIQLKYNKQYLLDNLLLNIRSIKNGTL